MAKHQQKNLLTRSQCTQSCREFVSINSQFFLTFTYVCVCLNVERNIIIIHFVMRIIISIPPEIMISRYWNAKLLLYNVNVNTHYYLFILLCEVECAESIEAEIRCRLIYHSAIVHVYVDSIMNYIE